MSRHWAQCSPRWRATYWFPKKPDHWPPGSGALSLIVNGRNDPHKDTHTEDLPFLTNADIHRWAERYGARGLSITLVANTYGFAVRSVALPPAAEADSLKWYFLEYQKLPVTLAVIQDSVLQWPTPDGRRFACTVSGGYRVSGAPPSGFWNVCYDTAPGHVGYDADVTLLGRDGRLLYAGDANALFEAVLTRAMAGAGPTSSSIASPTTQDSTLSPQRINGTH